MKFPFVAITDFRRQACSAALLITLLSMPLIGLASTTNVASLSKVERAAEYGKTFLLAQIGPTGQCKGEYLPKDYRFGYKTAICTYALLSAGVKEDHPVLSKALEWLNKAELHGTAAVAMRACAFAACTKDLYLPALKRDVGWLLHAASPDGSYTNISARGKPLKRYDNQNSQLAVMGVWAGMLRGVNVPERFWKRVRLHWLDQQQIDGGWAYRIRPGAYQAEAYGSVTAAGLATLLRCEQALSADSYVRCATHKTPKPITKAYEWLAKEFLAGNNPHKGVQWYYQWLHGLARIGQINGRKYLGKHNWFDLCVSQMLLNQKYDGGWGYGRPDQRIEQTAWAMLFLNQSRQPIVANKLMYAGKWNCRPHDLLNFARHISYRFERSVSWQVVDDNCQLEDLHDAPILYISGAGPMRLSEKQIKQLRQFVLQGGTILTEAAGNSGTFTLDVQDLCRELFPKKTLTRIEPDHPLFNVYFKVEGLQGLSIVSNGVRPYLIHSPRELSLALQTGVNNRTKPVYDLLANVFMLSTDAGKLYTREQIHWPLKKSFTPKGTFRVARVKYEGNYDPEPMAWERLAILMGNRYQINLEVSQPMELTKLNVRDWPVAHMTGTDSFTLSLDEEIALRKYLQKGGSIILDAAGGSKAFTSSVEALIVPLSSVGRRRNLASMVGLSGPAGIKRVYYRRELARALGPSKDVPLLRGAMQDKRLAIIYSQFDITTGLAGYEGYTIAGYKPDSAVALMTNLLWKLTPKQTTTQPTSQPTSQPTTQSAETRP